MTALAIILALALAAPPPPTPVPAPVVTGELALWAYVSLPNGWAWTTTPPAGFRPGDLTELRMALHSTEPAGGVPCWRRCLEVYGQRFWYPTFGQYAEPPCYPDTGNGGDYRWHVYGERTITVARWTLPNPGPVMVPLAWECWLYDESRCGQLVCADRIEWTLIGTGF